MQPQRVKIKETNWKHGDIRIPQKYYNLRSNRPNNFKSITADVLLAQHIFFKPAINHIYDNTGKKQSVDKLLRGKQVQTI